MRDNRIVELRFEEGSTYVWAGKLHIGSTLEEALAVLGPPDETVTGQSNTFKDKVLYRDIDGQKGHDYYHRPDQNVRVWFWNDKVIGDLHDPQRLREGAGRRAGRRGVRPPAARRGSPN